MQPHIGERAAVPVRIEIMDALPTTAVGKLFKPKLVWRAAEHALTEILRKTLGEVADIEVAVGPDETLGRRATIRIHCAAGQNTGDIRTAATQAVSGFAIHSDLVLPEA